MKMKSAQNRAAIATSKQDVTTHKNVQAFIEIGHRAWLRSPDSQEAGKTHDWVLFVCGKDNQECRYVDRVDFLLHETFENPIRVVKEPPFEIHESGYGSFLATVVVHFKVKEAPELHVASYYYDLTLPAEGQSPIGLSRCEKVTFKSVSMDFVELVLSGGGVIVSDEVAEDAIEARQAEIQYYQQENQMFPTFDTYIPSFSATTMDASETPSSLNLSSGNKSKKSKKQNRSTNSTPTLPPVDHSISNEKKQFEKNLFSNHDTNSKKSKSESKSHGRSSSSLDPTKNISERKSKKKHEFSSSSSTRRSDTPLHQQQHHQSPANVKQHSSKKVRDNLLNDPVVKTNIHSQKSTSSKSSNTKKNELIASKDDRYKADLPNNSTSSSNNNNFNNRVTSKESVSIIKSQSNQKENILDQSRDYKPTKKSPQNKKAFTKSQLSGKSIASKPVSHLENTQMDALETKESSTSTKNKRSSNEFSSSASPLPTTHTGRIPVDRSSDDSPQSDISHISATGDTGHPHHGGRTMITTTTASGVSIEDLLEIQERIVSLKDDEVEGLIYLDVFRIFNKGSNRLNGTDVIEFDLMKADLTTVNQIKRCLGM